MVVEFLQWRLGATAVMAVRRDCCLPIVNHRRKSERENSWYAMTLSLRHFQPLPSFPTLTLSHSLKFQVSTRSRPRPWKFPGASVPLSIFFPFEHLRPDLTTQ